MKGRIEELEKRWNYVQASFFFPFLLWGHLFLPPSSSSMSGWGKVLSLVLQHCEPLIHTRKQKQVTLIKKKLLRKKEGSRCSLPLYQSLTSFAVDFTCFRLHLLFY